MNAVVIEHVSVAELPQAWRDKLGQNGDLRVTIRIEAEESVQTPTASTSENDPLFGMWRDRDDMADVAGHLRKLRAARFAGHESGDAD